MIQKILTKTDKWLKIILLIFANITVLSFTLAAIVFLSMSDNQIKLAYPNQNLYEMIIQMKDVFKVLIWFLVPLSLIIIVINVWKLYKWLYSKRETKLADKKINKDIKRR